MRLAVTGREGASGRRVIAVHRRRGVESTVGELPLGEGDDAVVLTVRARGQDYSLLAHGSGAGPVTVAVVDGRALDSVTTGGFVGLWIGAYATSNGRPTRTVAHLERFDYVPTD